MPIMITIKRNSTMSGRRYHGATTMIAINMTRSALLRRRYIKTVHIMSSTAIILITGREHRHHTLKNAETTWPITMVLWVRMTLLTKVILNAIHQGHDTATVNMETMSIITTKSLICTGCIITTKSIRMIITNTTTMSQVTWSHNNIKVMACTIGDVDVHSHFPTAMTKTII